MGELPLTVYWSHTSRPSANLAGTEVLELNKLELCLHMAQPWNFDLAN